MDDDYIDANTTVYVLGEYVTKNEAVTAAKTERAYVCQFEDWAEAHYGDDEPPYHDGELDSQLHTMVFIHLFWNAV